MTSLLYLTFESAYKDRCIRYMAEVTGQTGNNLELVFERIDRISVDLLSNSDLQRLLKESESLDPTSSDYQICRNRINEISMDTEIFEDYVGGIEICSKSGNSFKAFKDLVNNSISIEEPQVIFDANGSAIWGTVSEDGTIVMTRAILDLVSMKPIGYMNIMLRNDRIKQLIAHRESIYSSFILLEDANNHTVCTSDRENLDFSGIALNSPNESEISFDSIEYYCYSGRNIFNNWHLVTLIPASLLEEELASISFRIWLITGVLLLIGIIGIISITHKITKPIGDLNKTMQAIADGDFSKRTTITSDDEIGSLSKHFNEMAAGIEQLIEDVYQSRLSQKETEIELLKMQINPHFLYNTLDMITWMLRMRDEKDIAEITVSLGKFLRASIKQDAFVTVRVELETVKNYLTIQKYRFQDKLAVVTDIDKEMEEDLIPGFILQPLVENAVTHGVEPKCGPGNIQILGIKRDGMLLFTVSDDGVGIEEARIDEILSQCVDKSFKDHIGIQNVWQRLHSYYGEQMLFQMKSVVGKGTSITIGIPEEISN